MSLLNPASRIFVARMIGQSKGTEIIGSSYRQTTFIKEAELYFPMGRKCKLRIGKFHRHLRANVNAMDVRSRPIHQKWKGILWCYTRPRSCALLKSPCDPTGAARSWIREPTKQRERERQTKRHRDFHTPLYTAFWRMDKAGHHQSIKQGPCEWGLTCDIEIVR